MFDIFGCYSACHVVYSCCVFDIFGCYAACHVVYLTYLDVMLLLMLCICHACVYI